MGSWAKKEKRTEFVKRKVETLLLNWKKRLYGALGKEWNQCALAQSECLQPEVCADI